LSRHQVMIDLLTSSLTSSSWKASPRSTTTGKLWACKCVVKSVTLAPKSRF